MAVSLDSAEIELYTPDGGYCKAVCRAEGREVVFVPPHRPRDALHRRRSGAHRSGRLRGHRQIACATFEQVYSLAISRDGQTLAVAHRRGRR